MPRRIVAEAIIECSGEHHVIKVDSAGRLIVDPDKHDADLERSLAALGAELPYCLQLLDDWQAGRVNHLTRPLRQAFRKLNGRYIKKIEDAIETADYRTPSDRWVDRAGVNIEIDFIDPDSRLPYIYAETEKVWHSKYGKRTYPGTLLNIKAGIDLPKYKSALKIFKDGLVRTTDGKDLVVLAARKAKRGATDLYVRAGRQVRGLQIVPSDALAVPDTSAPHGYRLKKWL